jgi:hypothetical protein
MRYLYLILSVLWVATPAYAQGACGLESRFEAGVAGRVTPGDANNVRDMPTRNGVLVGQIEAGQVFGVVGESRCAEDLTWIEVEFVDEGETITGWTVEGSPDTYFVDPLQGTFISFVDDSISVSLVLPPDIASAAEFAFYEEEVVVEDDPYPATPAYYEITFIEDYPDSDTREGFERPAITFFADGYGSMEALLEEQPDLATFDVVGENRLPDAASIGVAHLMLAFLDYVDFGNGSGIRFLTHYGQDFVGASNSSLIYRYQGIATSGYYVDAWLPVDAPDVPEQAFDYYAFESSEVSDAFEAYADEQAAFFEALPMDTYTPDLTLLDALVASLWVEGVEQE